MNFFKKLKYLLLELKDLGLVGSIYRISYEAGWRSGFYEFLEKQKSKKYLNTQINLSFDDWKKSKKPFFVDSVNPHIKTFLKNLKQNEKQQIIDIADKSLKGKILCFSKWFADYNTPINWHINPVKKIKWSKDIHWSKALKYQNGGDIKLVWEINRFPHFYYLVRAWYLTDDKKYLTGSLAQIKNWAEENPYLYGVNWASGQELAIRIFAWLFALYNFYEQPEYTEQDFQILIRQIYLHAQHIDHNINYAYYAVHNNHLIGEALALFVIGTLFPQLPGAKKWIGKGKRILVQKTTNQFYNDGGYCQLSHNYHRLAIHYYLWVLRIAELNNDDFDGQLKKMILKSADLLYQNMNLKNGQLPNWGNNDGALLNPWTACDYSDFRPVVQAAFVLCGQPAPLPTGTWDEETTWFTGIEIQNRKILMQETNAFEKTGLYVLRESEKDFGVFRCGTGPDRFGHADQLHFDLIWDGNNILTDGGSYLYNDELQFHRYFMGTNSHNTIIIDDQDQMLLWRRFKWIFKTKAKSFYFDPDKRSVSGEHYGYFKLNSGLLHRRNVELGTNQLLVQDEILNPGKKQHQYKLHWLVDADAVTNKNDKIKIIKNNIEYLLYINVENKIEMENFELKIKSGFNQDNQIDGWQSRYYGEKKKIFCINYLIQTKNNFKINSIFSKESESNSKV